MKARYAAVMAGLALGLMSGKVQAAFITTLTTPGEVTLNIQSGSYIIRVAGAGGGGSEDFKTIGGYGAVVTGTFTFARSETLDILVGGLGGSGSVGAGGGGGGTFVIGPGSVPLIVAGGGGGGGGIGSNGSNGGPLVNVGGTGGLAGAGPWAGAGGGGFADNGADGDFPPGSTINAGGGRSYVNDGTGGIAGWYAGVGGVGGGGGGGWFDGGGGGGGYTGGAGGATNVGGLGGFSYNTGTDQHFAFASSLADGSVNIIELPSAVPLPASAPMFGAAVVALGAVGFGLKRKRSAAA